MKEYSAPSDRIRDLSLYVDWRSGSLLRTKGTNHYPLYKLGSCLVFAMCVCV